MTQVELFLAQYQLEQQHVYLLELMPLIKMIWADGRNQPEEVALLQRFTNEHLANLAQKNEGLLPVSIETANAFIDRFTRTEPSPQMLDDLSQLCADRLKGHKDLEYSSQQINGIIDFCIDIAAACAADYPYEFDERVVAAEKYKLRQLISEFSRP